MLPVGGSHGAIEMNLGQKYRQWVVYRETVSVLNECSDRSLDDLGIRREDIRAVAFRQTRSI